VQVTDPSQTSDTALEVASLAIQGAEFVIAHLIGAHQERDVLLDLPDGGRLLLRVASASEVVAETPPPPPLPEPRCSTKVGAISVPSACAPDLDPCSDVASIDIMAGVDFECLQTGEDGGAGILTCDHLPDAGWHCTSRLLR
jgi:hypothetical protein